MNILLSLDEAMTLQRVADRSIAACVAESIADSGARAWQRGAPRWDHGFMEHEHLAAAWLRGWSRAAAEFLLDSAPMTREG